MWVVLIVGSITETRAPEASLSKISKEQEIYKSLYRALATNGLFVVFVSELDSVNQLM